MTKWFELLDDAARSDKGGWPERLKRGAVRTMSLTAQKPLLTNSLYFLQGRASLDENPLIDASMGGPPTEFVSGTRNSLSEVDCLMVACPHRPLEVE